MMSHIIEHGADAKDPRRESLRTQKKDAGFDYYFPHDSTVSSATQLMWKCLASCELGMMESL
jgi:hypothetical protein